MQTRWEVAESPQAWLKRALAQVQTAAAEAIAARGAFHLVLAGGATPLPLYAALAAQPHDYTRWQLWFGDERCLPADDPQRNSRAVQQAWLDKVLIPPGNVHVIPAERGPQAAAAAYAEALRAVDRFDLVLLGLGEDGHTASLFPGQDWGEAEDAPAVLPVYAAPKPPPERVSLSARRLAQTQQALFLVQGAGKRAAVAAWRRGERIPAAAIRPPGGVTVLLDVEAWEGT
ncbi:MAG: 6-phosphogluconolactonase [Thiobacillaceae bacterium]|nr:6-phosphogluconolactonase [Thiobacillaceae bacterium]MDW8323726.1 6-phosphogluconolactonase [Burkholderiales bacterium]